MTKVWSWIPCPLEYVEALESLNNSVTCSMYNIHINVCLHICKSICTHPLNTMQVKKQQLQPDIKQWTASKLGKEYIKIVYYHPAYLTYMQCKKRKRSHSVMSNSLQPYGL